MARDVYFTGSIPLSPAAEVFQVVGEHVGAFAPRIPDGEQGGWIQVARRTLANNPSLAEGHRIKRSGDDDVGVPTYHLKPGFTAKDLTLGPYGYGKNALDSYEQFKRIQIAHGLPAGTRFQFTMPGPGTSTYNIGIPAEQLLPISAAALWREIEEVLPLIPAEDLCCQLDIGMEAEHEEYRRKPEVFDTPNHQFFDWTTEQIADSIAFVVNRIPPDVEVGFHICSIWHHFQGGGQDNNVLVDTANALAKRLTRPLGYVHLPVIPKHEEEDYAVFSNLRLPTDTKLYLGVINLADGVAGAKRRLEMAERHVNVDGVAFFCGLGGAAQARSTTPFAPPVYSTEQPKNPQLKRATPDTIGAVLDLHREIAEL